MVRVHRSPALPRTPQRAQYYLVGAWPGQQQAPRHRPHQKGDGPCRKGDVVIVTALARLEAEPALNPDRMTWNHQTDHDLLTAFLQTFHPAHLLLLPKNNHPAETVRVQPADVLQRVTLLSRLGHYGPPRPDGLTRTQIQPSPSLSGPRVYNYVCTGSTRSRLAS